MSTNYSLCVTQIANITAISSGILVNGDSNFGPIFPAAIDFAEQKIYRELDLLATRVTDTSASVSSGVQTFTLPTATGTFLVVEQINLFSSAGTTSSNGTRNPVTFTSRDIINAIYPTALSSQTGLPEFAAMASNTQVVFGPAPDAAYVAEVIGTQRPTPLSAANSSTILTQMLPDLFNAALMIFMAGQMRDFGSQSDNPQMAVSWTSQYDKLFQSANVEELRKRYMGPAWQSQTPSPIATPPRA